MMTFTTKQTGFSGRSRKLFRSSFQMTWLLCGLVLWMTGCPRREISRQAIRHYKNGAAYYQQGQLFAARKRFLQALDHDKEFAPAYEGLGMILARRGLYRKAIAMYKKSINYDPNTASVWVYLGQSQQALKMYTSALRSYRRSLSLNARLLPSRMGMSQSYRALGATEKARQECLFALTQFPRKPHPHEELGRIYLQQQRVGQAVSSFQRALKYKSDFEPALMGLAESYMLQKKYTLARPVIRQILTLNSSNIPARRWLQIVRKALGSTL